VLCDVPAKVRHGPVVESAKPELGHAVKRVFIDGISGGCAVGPPFDSMVPLGAKQGRRIIGIERRIDAARHIMNNRDPQNGDLAILARALDGVLGRWFGANKLANGRVELLVSDVFSKFRRWVFDSPVHA
jgi:hypothetical protein